MTAGLTLARQFPDAVDLALDLDDTGPSAVWSALATTTAFRHHPVEANEPSLSRLITLLLSTVSTVVGTLHVFG